LLYFLLKNIGGIMARKTQRPKLELTNSEKEKLVMVSRSRSLPLREIQRAKILLLYSEEMELTNIQKELNISRPTIYKCIDKALSSGIETGLKDYYHRPKEPVITEEAKAWVINLACSKPKEYGYATEIWSLSKLAKHTRTYAPKAGFQCLDKAAKATIQRILKAQPLQPHKIKYYLEKRDEDFEKKMNEVLLVYREVNQQNDLLDQKDNQKKIITVSADEKPGIQAIKNIAPDLPPVAGKYKKISRDYEYKRLGTLSVLAALDLHTGHIIAQVHERHRSREFIQLLKELNDYYPKDAIIRIVLDNHSAHISKETRAYLATKPNRFIYVHTPKHGSWLNLVETLFSKVERTFLKNIRVDSKQELKERILKGFEEINSEPVVHRWKKFDLLSKIM
jgi:transposase